MWQYLLTQIAKLKGEISGSAVGNLSDLTTTDKSSAVAAINEVNSSVSTLTDAIPSKVIRSIPNSTDLNTLRNGVYKCVENAVAATMTNCPTNVAFLMIASHSSQAGCVQWIATANSMYVRRAISTGWGNWFRFEGTDTGS